jgi:putative membrane protein
MIRYLRYVLLLALGLSLLTIALANRDSVELNLLPDDLAALMGVDWAMQVPLFLVIFAGILAGLVIGFVWEWVREMKHRSLASIKTREVKKLERELAVLKDQTALPGDDVLALLDTPKAR